jgi:putative PIN family toxin of toxin-antitoxin system
MRPPELATFVMAWQSRRFAVVCSSQLLREYEIVMAYPKVEELIYPELRRIFLTQLSQEIEFVELPEIAPVCRDPDDDKVIATAVFGEVDYLITADDDLRTPALIKVLEAAGISTTTIDELLKILN